MIDAEALSCQELVELITDYVEGALDVSTARAFEEHLAGCPDCTRYLRQFEETIRMTGTLTLDDLTPDAERTLLQAFHDFRRRS